MNVQSTEQSNLHVVEAACKFTPDNKSGTVVIESDRDSEFNLAIEELQSAAAKNLAVGYASKQGMGDTRYSNHSIIAYAINSKGVPLEDVRDDDGQIPPPQHPDRQPAAYRVDISVVQKLV